MPRILFLNKVDKADASVRETLQTLQPASGVPLVLRHIPIWQDDVVTGFIDLALERAFVYREHAPSEVIPIPDEDKAREVEARFHMLETLADYDDELMEQLLEEIEPPRDQIFDDLVKEMRDGLICPVLIGAAEHGNGIGRLLKAIRHEAPDIADTRARLGIEPNGDAVVQVLKTLHTTHGGKLSIARVLVRLGRRRRRTGRPGRLGRPRLRRLPHHGPAHHQARRGRGRRDGRARQARRRPDRHDARRTGKTAPPQVVTLAPPEPVLGTAVASAERKDDVKLSAALTKAGRGRPVAAHHPHPGHRRDAGRRAGGDAPARGDGAADRQVRHRRRHPRAGGALQGDDPRRGQRARPPQEAVRRPRPVRRRGARHQAAAARRRLRVRRDGHRRRRAAQLFQRRSRRASPSISARGRSASRWSTCR